MHATLGIEQLCIHVDLLACPSHAAFEHISDTELAADLFNVGEESIASALGDLFRRKKSARRAGKASIFLPRARYRPHPISRARSVSRAEKADSRDRLRRLLF